jgi:hypothetical protein
MSQIVNSMIQKALQVDMPEEVQPEPTVLPMLVEPHELPAPVENPALPNMNDIDRRMTEGEKQLEEMITMGREIIKTIYEDELPNSPPKMRRGVLEQMTAMFSQTLDAIKHKTKLQIDKKGQRMEEAAFTKKEAGTGGGVTNNMFFGTHEEMKKALKQSGFIEEEK